MRFKFLILGLLLLTGCSKWFGEDRPTPPLYKFQYTKNDRFTVESFKMIGNNYDRYVLGKLQNNGFIQAINRSMALLDLATAKLDGKYKDAYTQSEIQFILTSGILDESQQVKVWIRRFVALINILLGDEHSEIQMSDVHEIFRRLVLIGPYMVSVSDLQHELSFLQTTSENEAEKYWKIKKQVFSDIIKMAKVLFQNDRGKIEFPLVKQVILNQYRYLDSAIDTDYWDRFIEAGFFVNRIIFGRSERMIGSDNIFELFDVIDGTYQHIFDVYAIGQRKVWGSEEYASILLSYHMLLHEFLDLFCAHGAESIEVKDLNKLFKLLHLGTQSESELFTNALLDLKTILFQSTNRSFSREDIQKIRNYLKSTIEKTQGVERSNSQDMEFQNKIKMLWGSPFQPKEKASVSDVKLSLMLLNGIDYVMGVYDGDHDQKLSFESANEKELNAFLKTLRQFVEGFHQMLGDSPSLQSVTNLNEATIGNVLIATTDHLLLNGNQDGKLDRFEMLEMASFILENDRFVSSHFWSPTFASYRKESGNDKKMTIDKIEWLTHAGEEPQFRAYFPRLMPFLSNSSALRSYLQRFVSLYQMEADTLSMADLKLIMGTLRAIEQIFLKYDLNGNNILDGNEILALFDDMQPLIEKAYGYYEAKNSKGVGELISNWWDGNITFGEGWRYLRSSPADVQKNIFFYVMTHGFFPTHYPEDPSKQDIQWSTRKDVMNVISRAVGEFKKANLNAEEK